MQREKFDVVDDRDEVKMIVTGKEKMHFLKLCHRSVHVFLEVLGGGFIIQKKAEHTENGGKWSSAVSGHVRSGESYRDAAIREAKEELDLTVTHGDLKKITKLYPTEQTDNEFVTLYRATIDLDKVIPSIACDELDGLLILPLKDLIIDIDKYMKTKYSKAFVALLNIFLAFEGDAQCTNQI